MNILISGSTGFVGKHLVPELINQGHKILELTRRPQFSRKLYNERTEKFNIADSYEQLSEIIKTFKPEIFIHLASFLTSADDHQSSKKIIDANIVFLNEVLSALRDSELKLLINTGTFAEYFKGDGNLEPAYLYAATKTASRHIVDYYANAFGFNYVNVIPYTIYGGKDSKKKIIDYIYDSLGCKKAIDLSPGMQILDFIHIRDVVKFYCMIIKQYKLIPNKTIYHLGTGKGHNLKQIAKLIENTTKKTANINWGGKQYRKTDIMYAIADTSTIKEHFNWKPDFLLSEGINEYLKEKAL